LSEVKNILVESIPYFMRYDEAQMETTNFALEQNNFYIVNFSFVPASVLFYLMYWSIKEATAEAAVNILGDKYFYFSTYESKAERDDRVEN
jgi:hypothetical protein